MNTQQPSLRFRLHEHAVRAFKAAPPPPVVITKESKREHRTAIKLHFNGALLTALNPTDGTINRYQRKIWNGILRRLRGQQSTVQPLFKKETIMPALREWAEKRGLI